MARTPATLYSSASIAVAKTEVVEAESNTIRIIRRATFTNNSGGTLTVDLYIDPSGSVEVQVADTKVLIDRETWSCPDAEGHVLEAAGTIDVTASGAGIDLVITGIKVT
jgi:hypothetical protein